MPQPIRVSFDDGTIFCTPDKGNAWVPAGDVRWMRGQNVVNFRLIFRREPTQGGNATSDWPFSNPQPMPNTSSTDWERDFTGTVKGEAGVYEYTIEANVLRLDGQQETLFLDPMIIVGRV